MARFTDQQIRDKGFLYIPKQEYLTEDFKIPTTKNQDEDEVVTDQGIVNTNAFANAGGGGDNFSVYNPDPNTIVNQDYNDGPYQTAINAPYQTSIDNQEFQENAAYDQGFINDDEELTGIRSLISKGVNLIPGMGMLKMGAQAIGSLLPTNYRAIMENELGGQGIMVNDIGQIVQGQGDYNTGANIMAGYNANKITDSTVQKRIDTIRETIARKTKTDPNYDPSYLESRLDALNDFNKMRQLAFARSNIVYANENYDPSTETPVGADTITGPDINEDPNPDGDVPTTEPPGYIGGGGSGVPDQIGPPSNNETNFGGGDGPGDQSQQGANEAQNEDNQESAGAGGYRRGGRVKYFYGGKV